MEESVPSSAGPHSAIFQGGRVGPRSPAPVWIKGQPSSRPLCVLDPSLSFLRSKRATPRVGMRAAVTGTKKDRSSGTSHWLERQRSHLDVLWLVTLMGSCPLLHPTGLSLPLEPPQTWSWEKVSTQHPARSNWRRSSPRAGERKAFPTRRLRVSPAVVPTPRRMRLCGNQTRKGFRFHLKLCHQARRPRAKARRGDSAKVRHAS